MKISKCLKPFIPKDRPSAAYDCRKCHYCRQKRATEWGLRLLEEYKVSKTAYFVTYSYDTTHVPINNQLNMMTLYKRDIQLYFKRLRKQTGNGIRYYIAGEYGPNTHRPHYHAIIFNAQLKDIIPRDAGQAERFPEIYLDGKYHLEDPSWGKGHITIGLVNIASVTYCLKYITKKVKVPMFKGDTRVPEFQLMSKGLGKNYLTDDIIQWHRAKLSERIYCTLDGNRPVKMPTYYKKRIYKPEELEQVGIQYVENQMEEYQNLTFQQRQQKNLEISKIRENIVRVNQLNEKDNTIYSI